MTYVIKNKDGRYWGNPGWTGKSGSIGYPKRGQAYLEICYWPESTHDREQPRVVRLVPKKAVRPTPGIRETAGTYSFHFDPDGRVTGVKIFGESYVRERDEAAIRRQERARIAALLGRKRRGCDDHYFLTLNNFVIGSEIHSVECVRDIVLACTWPAGTEGKKT